MIHFGEDYTAKYLFRLGRLIEENVAQKNYGMSFVDLPEEKRYLVRKNMQQELNHIPLSQSICILPQAVADSILQMKQEIAKSLLQHEPQFTLSQRKAGQYFIVVAIVMSRPNVNRP